MKHEAQAIVIQSWQLYSAATVAVSLACLAISALVLRTAVQRHQLRTNKIPLAVSAVLAASAVGQALNVLPSLVSWYGSAGGDSVPTSHWGLTVWQLLTALVAWYCLSQRGLYHLPLVADVSEPSARQQIVGHQRPGNGAAGEPVGVPRDLHVRMLQAVIEGSPSLVYCKDLDGRYLLTCPLLDSLLGLESGEATGRTDYELAPEMAPHWRANDLRAQEGRIVAEEWFDSADGRRYYESTKFPLHDAEGVVYAVCGMSLDVTERRAAAQEGIERDAALAAKSAFLATMSHEIRTPMNAVIGMSDLLSDTNLDEHQREFVQTIGSSGNALLALINDILDFSKIESGQLELESIPFDLRSEAEASVDQVLAPASAKGIELLCDIDPDCPAFLIGDVHRIRQILANLLSNAVKFTERGEVLLTVETERLGDGKVRVSASVADSGIGIASGDEDRLFRSFSQVDASTTRVYGGTGLGLAISRRLAEAMGGQLRLAQTGSAGSTFVLDLVLPGSVASADGHEQGSSTPPDLVGKSALLVDDNRTNLRILDLQLSSLGMTCTSFESPKAALARVADGLTYDVAILDMHMPQMDGITLGASLKELPHCGSSPLVLLTSLGWKPAGVTQFFAAFLTKPAKRTALQQALVTVLQGGQDRTERLRSTRSSTQPMRILLAEDNPVNQRVAQLMLDSLGHQVDTVANGVEAVEAATTHPYDVVLMDVQMPQMDGLEAARRICAELPADTRPHIVALTANALTEDRDACMAAGMHSYLSKPVRLTDLEAVLAGALVVATPDGPQGSSDAPIDHEVLAEVMQQVDGDPTAGKELIDQYLTEADHQVVLLTDLVADGDLPRVKSVTHTWRSTSALLGASRLAGMLQRLEDASKDVASTDCRPLAQEIEAEYAKVKQTLARDLI